MPATKLPSSSNSQVFQKKLNAYKKMIDDDIKSYSKRIAKTTLQQYGTYSKIATDAYLDILNRGGKRIRGSLVMLGYEMSGGTDRKMIVQAALAVEMIHAYILIIDDIQDRSPIRRGGPAAHESLASYHKKHNLGSDSDHFGLAIAINSALAGNHAAQMLLANLNVDEDLRLKVLSIVNRTMVVTTHGQTNDIFNEVNSDVDEKDVDRVLEWKTAHYTFLNPLHVGMVLAGADCAATDAITKYALHAGRAFQISDDVLGTFGEEFDSGKSPLDDIREGKRTILTVYALRHTSKDNKNYLIQMLGNRDLTKIEFDGCKAILEQSGALAYAKKQVKTHVVQAINSLGEEANRWGQEGAQFLSGLAEYLLTRTS